MMDASLSQKQQAFVREYVVDRNATQAAIRAGYSPKTAESQGSRLLSYAKVRQAADVALAAAAKKTETTSEWVRRRLKEEAESFGSDSSQAARVRAIEIVAKLNGMFELDNAQQKAQSRVKKIEWVIVDPGKSLPDRAFVGTRSEPLKSAGLKATA